MRKWLLRFVYAALVMAPIGAAADYLATAGGATTVFAFVCSATKVCPAFVLIDSTNVEKATAGNPLRIDPTGTTPQPVNATQTGTWTVQPGNTANTTAWKVDGSAVTQPVSGTVTANAGTNLNTSTLATAANQATNTATSAHTCSVAGFSELGCLGQIDDDVKGPVAAGTARIGYTSDDVCTQLTKTNVGFGTSAGTLQLVAPSGSTQVYVCSLTIIANAAAVVSLIGGTGAACTTGTPAAIMGSTTLASGMSLAANGGLTFGNGGATVTRTTTAGHGVCLEQSGVIALAGSITYVQQ